MNAAEAKEAVNKYGSQRAAERALGLANGTICNAIKRGVGIERPAVARNPLAAGRKTLSDFRSAYDKNTIVPAKIKEALKALGPDGWEYEVAFAKMAGVSLYDLGRVRDVFAANVVTIGRDSKRAWAGSPVLAKQMREML